uniref:Major facilitator superfamily MFS_1 n=1 Tax=Gloeothece verrucosa (strain PCC 7822) TaxID=497965 RepID=E0UKN9_GLOV7|nr:hypothetical protein Cyan7822_5654 [Gloeothece verrucosa PCC 7822]
MNKKLTVTLFYIMVTLFAASDMAMVIAMVWYTLSMTKSTFLVGIILCISTVIPFILEKWLNKKHSTQLSINRLIVIRLIAFTTILVFTLMHLTNFVIGFLMIAFVVGMIDYFTISTLEAQNTKLVLAGVLDSHKSARFIETAIQLGAFGGDFLGGVAIDSFSVTTTLTTISAMAIMFLGLLFIPQIRTTTLLPQQEQKESEEAIKHSYGSAKEIFLVILALGMIGFHIGAFNSLVPIIFQKLNTWSATSLGIASGLAGVGAFIGAMIPGLSINLLWLVTGVTVMDIALVYSPSALLACSAAFLIGFCLNQLRISFRKYLIEQSHNPRVADLLATRSSFYYLLLSGSAPMILTLFTTDALFGLEASRPLMILTSLVLGLVVIARLVMSRKTYRFN